MPDWSWQTDAACRGQDVRLFVGRDGERAAEKDYREQVAKQQFCTWCPIVDACLDYAISAGERGVWGGMNDAERASERRRRQRRAATAVHVETPIVTSKYCRRCEKTRAASEFGRDIRARDGLNSMCRACIADASRKRRAAEKQAVA